MSNWLKTSFGNFVENSILSSGLMSYFNVAYIRGLFADQRSGRQENAVYILDLFNLTAWYGYWIEGKAVRAA